MNDLEQYFKANNKLLMHKWLHYFDVYDKHFGRFRNSDAVILEIGVSQGGSLQMWKEYFGEGAKIYGIDVDSRCKQLEAENIGIFIGSQSDKNFLMEVKSQIPKIDILVDDGGHTMVQQITSFEELFDHVKDDGVYLCEDVHTSYRIKYGGGHKRGGTFIEYSKNFIDYLNAYHSEQKSLRPNHFTRSVDSVHFYDSIVVIEKRKRGKPQHEKTGNQIFVRHFEEKHGAFKRLKRFLLLVLNRVLRFFRLKGIIWR